MERAELVCRPNRASWWLVAFAGIFGGLSFLIPLSERQSADLPKDWMLAFFFCTCYLIPAALGAVWLLRARIIADRSGLRWRVLGPWHRADWEEVSDYYEALLPGRQKSTGTPFVIVAGVKRVKFRSDWSQSEELCAAVEREAKGARAGQWGVCGTRKEDEWPRVFDYQSLQIRRTMLARRLILFGLLLFWLWLDLPRLVRTYGTAEWRWDAIMAALFGLMLIAAAFVWSFWRYRRAQIRLDEGG